MIVYRVGEGQTSSGKIIDRGTRWYTEGELDDAKKYALKTNKNIYRKYGNNPYYLWNKNYNKYLADKADSK